MTTEALTTPQTGPLGRLIGTLIIKGFGWKVIDELPRDPKMVIIFAPHTSNWDWVFMVSAAYHIGLKPQVMMKKSFFSNPIGAWFFNALGGIPVDRAEGMDMTEMTIHTVREIDQMMLGIAPEGTRSKKSVWKTGFYHIAKETGLPVRFAYLDYKNKIAGFGEGFFPSEDVAGDLKIIQDYYERSYGKYPENAAPVKFRPYELNPNRRKRG